MSLRVVRRVGYHALAAALATLAIWPLSSPAAGTPNATRGPLIAGGTSYIAGTFVATDFAYDDTGPNSDNVPSGDATYPAVAERGNAADLIQLQLSLTAKGTVLARAVLETLTDATLPSLGIGFDTDNNATTGSRGVPGNGWTTDAPLGLEKFFMISSSGSRSLDWIEGSWREGPSGLSSVDVGTNTITADLPAYPDQATWRAVALTGLAPAGMSWTDGSGPIYDLAFVDGGQPCNSGEAALCWSAGFLNGVKTGSGSSYGWLDQVQADVLAGKRSAALAVRSVDFAKLAAGAVELATAREPRFYEILYHSGLDLGEGMEPSGPTYFGPYQPYWVKVPPDVDNRPPMVFFLHGLGLVGWVETHYSTETPTSIGALPLWGTFDPWAFVVYPLVRGGGGASGIGEQDVLDVYKDMTTRFKIDVDRVVMSGESLGGSGTFRMGWLYPELFTGILPHIWSTSSPLLANLLNVYVRTNNGQWDPLGGDGSSTRSSLDALGNVDYRSFVSMRRSHEVNPVMVNCLYKELLSRPRTANPARIFYRVEAANEISNPQTGLELHHTRAYWVSGLQLRNATTVGSIDVMSLAMPNRQKTGTPVDQVGENITQGRDFCGPNANVRTGEVWTEHGIQLQPGLPQPTSNGFSLALSGLSAATLDLARAGITVRDPIRFEVRSDGVAALTLLGPWKSGAFVSYSRDGLPVGTVRARSDGTILLEQDFTGTHMYELKRGKKL